MICSLSPLPRWSLRDTGVNAETGLKARMDMQIPSSGNIMAESDHGNFIPGLADFMAAQTFDPARPFFFIQHRIFAVFLLVIYAQGNFVT